ncbi:MAG TPA: hypothetical protein PKC70_11800, partial [Cellvibrionaceae bacterium]|nr:hypothetical protein [Cellvibrionaceae bacterium]
MNKKINPGYAFNFLFGFALADFGLLVCQKFINAIRSFIQRFRFLLKPACTFFTIASAGVRLFVFLNAV